MASFLFRPSRPFHPLFLVKRPRHLRLRPHLHLRRRPRMHRPCRPRTNRRGCLLLTMSQANPQTHPLGDLPSHPRRLPSLPLSLLLSLLRGQRKSQLQARLLKGKGVPNRALKPFRRCMG
eukprot:CCRYP_008459-RD/>CCRYP_008459-RD protein AED:0.29 eAED:0.34 QI:649/0.5/0.66/1/0.5/0.33/3/545/119